MLHKVKLFVAYFFSCILLALLVTNLQAADPPAAVAAQTDLRLNEFMTSNERSFEDPHEPGTFPDWIEIYNAGTDAVSLDGLYLTNDEADLTRFPIADGLTIPAGGFLVFIADDDLSQGPLHTNFTLVRDGGFIGLYHAGTQTLIDSHTYTRQGVDVSEGREVDGSGNWRRFIQVTPGASNMLLPPLIRSVELLPAQPLANTPVSVTAIITDDNSGVAASLFYSSTGETSYTAVPMTGPSGDGETYTAQIPARPDGAVVRYYVAAADSSNLTSLSPISAPARPYLYVAGFQPPVLYINEFMAENETGLENPALPGEFSDWIEIYNPGDAPVSMDGLFLTDSPNQPTMYAIPNGLVVPPGGFLLFYADNKPEQNLGPQHTNFTLSRGGEDIQLYGAEGTVLIDEYRFRAPVADIAEARFPDGGDEWRTTHCATPGAPNVFCAQISLPVIHNQ